MSIRAVCAAHAVIVGGSVIALDDLAAHHHRVGGARGATMHMPGYSRPLYRIGGAYPAGWFRLAHKYAAAIVRCGR